MQVRLETPKWELNSLQQHLVDKKLKKLDRLCRLFNADLVAVHLLIAPHKPPEGFKVNLSLSVPHRDLGVHTHHKKFTLAMREAFEKLLAQLRKYRAQLRREASFARVAKAKGKA